MKEIESGVVNVERKDDGSSLESGDNCPSGKELERICF